MQVLSGLEGLRRLPAGAVICIGNFDGVHRGHQRILAAARMARGEKEGRKLAVVTFEPHPLTVLKAEIAPPRLTPRGMKEHLLSKEGVDYLVVLPPEERVLNLRAEEFWALLRDEVKAAHLTEGEEFSFGKGREGTIQKLREWTARDNVGLDVIEAVRVALVDLWVAPVSSSLIRWLLVEGRVRDAAICLGRPYALEGEVVVGKGRGRTIGAATVNLGCAEQLVPADGVYAGRSQIEGASYPAAVSIGTAPTFGENARQVEAHLVGFDGDLYGKVVQVELLDWIRDQRKFKDVEALKGQMSRDIAFAVQRKAFDPAAPVVSGP